MILGPTFNTSVSAPVVVYSLGLLDFYREFSGRANATKGNLYTFLTTESNSRRLFLRQLSNHPTLQGDAVSNLYEL